MKKLKEMIEARNRKSQSIKEAMIAKSFQVVERGGALWLTYDGIGFLKFSLDASASEIAEAVQEARNAAITFERL